MTTLDTEQNHVVGLKDVIRKMTPFGHILDLQAVAVRLGYNYMLWNDRVYTVHSGKMPEDTGLTINDLK